MVEVRAEPLDPGEPHQLVQVRNLANLLDRRFTIPGTRLGIGLDALLGLLPIVGDAATVGPAAYIIGKAQRMGVRRRTLTKMGINLAIDFGVGLVPLVGDLLDIGYKANVKNVRLIEKDLAEQAKKRVRDA